MKTITGIILLTVSVVAAAQEDVAGSKDHPLFPRQPDYYISQYEVVDNDTTETFIYLGGKPITGAVHKTVITYQIKKGATPVSSSFILSNFQINIKKLQPKTENGEYANIVTASSDMWVHLKPFIGKGNKQKTESYILIIGENPRVTGRIPGAPSKFAGSYRSLVGKRISDVKDLTLLSAFNFTDKWQIGTATPYDFNGLLSVSWYTKGNLIVALYTSEQYADQNKTVTIILDALEVANVPKGQMLTVGVCGEAGKNYPSLAALVQPSENAQSYPAIKAWYFNPGTFQIDAWPADKVKCLPTGQD